MRDTAGGRHQAVYFMASHHYGANGAGQITVLSNSAYATDPVTQIRIKERSTYDGCALQVYVADATNALVLFAHMNEHTDSWTLLDTWVSDADTATHDTFLGYGASFSTFGVPSNSTIDLTRVDTASFGGIITNGEVHAMREIVTDASFRTAGTASAGLVLADTNSAGAAATIYAELHDSAGRMGYIGYGSGSNQDLYMVNQVGSVRISANYSERLRVESTKVYIPSTAYLELDGGLQHDGTQAGFFGAGLQSQPAGTAPTATPPPPIFSTAPAAGDASYNDLLGVWNTVNALVADVQNLQNALATLGLVS